MVGFDPWMKDVCLCDKIKIQFQIKKINKVHATNPKGWPLKNVWHNSIQIKKLNKTTIPTQSLEVVSKRKINNNNKKYINDKSAQKWFFFGWKLV